MTNGFLKDLKNTDDNLFVYTKQEFAEQLGITVECLRTRIRKKGYYSSYRIRKENGHFAYRKWEGPKKPKKSRNRGGHDDAVAKNRYPNKALEEHNNMKRYLAAKKQLSQEELDMVPNILRQIKENTLNDEVVYFITYYDPLIKKENRLIKIGKTKERTVITRYSSIQSCCPLNLTLLTYSKSKNEEFFHEKFKEHHVRGEWFKYEPVLHYLIHEHEEDYRLPDPILDTMKEKIDGEFTSQYTDKELCETYFKLKTNEKTEH